MVKLSALDLVRVREGFDASDALNDSRTLAIHLEKLGFHRVWVAEHHNNAGTAGAAVSVVLAHLGAATSKIRLAAGGIMLPNHVPYVIAEQFGTLARLFPGRVDLGLGRAPGTDQLAMRALRRSFKASDTFPQDVLELQDYFKSAEPGQRLVASPAEGTEVPLIILGSSLFGAQLAAQLGLPFAFASHFAPDHLLEALEIFRENFKPSETLAQPYAMVGVNVIVADTDDEAVRLATSKKMSLTNIFRGLPFGTLPPPIDDIDTHWSPLEKSQAMRMLAFSVVGSPSTVREGLDIVLESTKADELVIVTDVYDQAAKLRSFDLLWQTVNTTTFA